MTAPRFFAYPEHVDLAANRLTLVDEEARHATTVLRLRVGEAVTVLDGERVYDGAIERVGRSRVEVSIAAWRDAVGPGFALALHQAMPKAKKAEFIVEKATEVGVTEIVFFRGERSEGDISPARLERLWRHARAATKQCGRETVPTIAVADGGFGVPVGYGGALVAFDAAGEALEDALSRLPMDAGARLVVGPEGGLTRQELAALRGLGAAVAAIDSFVLRTETAAVVVCALARYEMARRARSRARTEARGR